MEEMEKAVVVEQELKQVGAGAFEVSMKTTDRETGELVKEGSFNFENCNPAYACHVALRRIIPLIGVSGYNVLYLKSNKPDFVAECVGEKENRNQRLLRYLRETLKNYCIQEIRNL